ncbi:MAG: hypothetical protein Q4A31_11145 [Corynebacterium sp.]|uniref:hypothetical protein n=1 Tax=Corynebacterium sp. TaxID=1720 RepID=UPI0026DCD005|nr:hypothetical protein [Corynebacterium sp.]MDO4762466.1 hypothetical protein [Corynebacterium sp.]
MSSDYWRVPVGDLHAIQSQLNSMHATLESVEGSAEGSDGVDDIHGAQIANAVSDFFNEWKQSRRVLMRNVKGMGEVSGQIAEAVTTFDTELASSLHQFASALRGENNGPSGDPMERQML